VETWPGGGTASLISGLKKRKEMIVEGGFRAESKEGFHSGERGGLIKPSPKEKGGGGEKKGV